MKRIYKNTDLNFPISLLPVTENEELIVKFFTRSDKQFIQKTKDDIIDYHIMLAWSELATLDEGVLNAWTLISSHDNNLPDDSYDVAEVRNTPYYIVTNQKSEWDDSIENTILNNYYTKSEVDEKLSNFDIGDINLSDYYTKKEVDEKVANVTVDLTGYATETWVNEQLQDIEVDVDLSDYALQSDLLELSGGVIDNEAVIAAALTELKETKLDKTEVPSFEGYATEEWVTEQINNVDVSDELQNYYTKDEVDEAIKNADIDLTGYATEEWVEGKNYITAIPENYVTESELGESLNNKADKSEIPSLSGYATEQWVNNRIDDLDIEVDLSQYVRQIPLTQAEYEALDQKKENVMYIITDVEDEWVGTQAEYDALETKNPETTYYITD